MNDAIFLLGAGASVPANLPSMPELTNMYEKYVDKNFSQEEKDIVQILKNALEQLPNIRKDIEGLMTLIRNLEDDYYSTLITSQLSELSDLDTQLLSQVNDKTQGFIRETLEKIGDTSYEYLSPLEGFLNGDPIEIYTLNYDGLIDLFCEKLGISYSDGFSPFWNNIVFEDTDIKIKLYRLHGCLYWFKTLSGKYIKIPVMGLDLDKVNYISSEKLSEVIIYPTIRKEKYSQVYSWLNNEFIESLQRCKLLIVVGYSFRDDDITSIIKEALYSHGLWLLIISPNASNHSKGVFDIDNLEVRSRIMYLNASFDSILHRGNLFRIVEDLLLNINSEKKVLNIFNQTPRKNNPIYLLIDRYLYLGCEERVKFLKQTVKPFYSPSDWEGMFEKAYEKQKEGKLDFRSETFLKYLNEWKDWDW
jgi:hypothetical protein